MADFTTDELDAIRQYEVFDDSRVTYCEVLKRYQAGDWKLYDQVFSPPPPPPFPNPDAISRAVRKGYDMLARCKGRSVDSELPDI